MAEQAYHLAQINIGRIRAPLDDPSMAGFVNRLDEINALADNDPGFIWRLQTEDGDATAMRPFADDTILVNMSLWRSPEALQEYVYRGDHVTVMRQRREWFEKFDGMYMALWWVPAGDIPTTADAWQRIQHLQAHGPSEYAFTFRQLFPPPDAGGQLAALAAVGWEE